MFPPNLIAEGLKLVLVDLIMAMNSHAAIQIV